MMQHHENAGNRMTRIIPPAMSTNPRLVASRNAAAPSGSVYDSSQSSGGLECHLGVFPSPWCLWDGQRVSGPSLGAIPFPSQTLRAKRKASGLYQVVAASSYAAIPYRWWFGWSPACLWCDAIVGVNASAGCERSQQMRRRPRTIRSIRLGSETGLRIHRQVP